MADDDDDDEVGDKTEEKDEEEDDDRGRPKQESVESVKEEEEVLEADLVDRSAAYQIRPPLSEKFKSLSVKEIIHNVMAEELGGRSYNVNNSEMWAQKIVNSVKHRVKELAFKRYKLIIQTVVGENKGAGVRVGARCLWDADTDNYASDSFKNETIFCSVVVFGIYCY